MSMEPIERPRDWEVLVLVAGVVDISYEIVDPPLVGVEPAVTISKDLMEISDQSSSVDMITVVFSRLELIYCGGEVDSYGNGDHCSVHCQSRPPDHPI